MMTKPKTQTKKEIALDMLSRMVGISDEQKDQLRELIEKIPEEKMEEVVKHIVETQKNIASNYKQRNKEVEGINLRFNEKRSQKKEDSKLKEIESQLN